MAERAHRSGESISAGFPAFYAVTYLVPLLLLVAGCQAPLNHPAATQGDSQPAAQSQMNVSKAVPLAATPAVAHDVVKFQPVSRLTGDPAELLGLDHAAVRRALGEPNRVRSEDPAQVWQYVTGDCIVDLYLYGETGKLKVTYVEARSHSAEVAPTGRCLKLLLERPTASAD